MIFVFGSNLRGLHGSGAAAFAVKHCGARMGVGVGLTGKSYGIPTKDEHIMSLELTEVEKYIKMFINYAQMKKGMKFKVTQIGCGLAGFTADQIAPLFQEAPNNCFFDTAWKPFLGKTKNYWGTFDV